MKAVLRWIIEVNFSDYHRIKTKGPLYMDYVTM